MADFYDVDKELRRATTFYNDTDQFRIGNQDISFKSINEKLRWILAEVKDKGNGVQYEVFSPDSICISTENNPGGVSIEATGNSIKVVGLLRDLDAVKNRDAYPVSRINTIDEAVSKIIDEAKNI